MRFFKHFLSLACLATLLFFPAQSFAEEGNPVEALQEIDQGVDERLTEDLISRVYYKKAMARNKSYENRWKPYIESLYLTTSSQYPYLQVNVGVGLLYFSGVKGGLTRSGLSITKEQDTFEGKLAYSRTPLVEMILGYQYNPWFQFGFSYQHQGDIDVQSIPQLLPATIGTLFALNQFKGSLRLDGFALKGYLNTPHGLIMKLISYSPYLGGGVGVSMQSWTNMVVDGFDFIGSSSSSSSSSSAVITDNFSLKNKYSANWFFMVDPGFKIQSMVPGRNFSVLLGCKFNYWGQARNLGGEAQMQDWIIGGLAHAIRIKSVYQFAPYLGFELDF